MYYETATNDHGLPHDPFKACIVPRPIGWISTRSAAGVNNIGPYSFFNAVASAPPMVMYSNNGNQPHGAKDTIANITETGEFVVNLATWELRTAINETSAPARPEVDEFTLAGLDPAPSRLIAAPRIAAAPINMECVLHQIIELPCDEPGGRNVMVLGRVLALHIDERVLSEGRIDMAKLQPIARLGYRDYAVIRDTFTMDRPAGGDRLAGL